MKILISIAAFLCLACNTYAQASGRIIGAQNIQLDDGSGHTYTITPPPSWTGNWIFQLPAPPFPAGPQGWIAPGTITGQVPIWSTSSNSWQPSNSSTANTALNNLLPN